MKRLIIAAASIALVAAAGTASAKTSHKKGYHAEHGRFVNRPVSMPDEYGVPPPNADLKYGPYPEYPQSPPGGGY